MLKFTHGRTIAPAKSYGKDKYGAKEEEEEEDEELRKINKYVTIGSGNFIYANKNTYMIFLLKDLYGKQLKEESRKKVCELYKGEYVKVKDEPKEAQEYLDKVLAKEKELYSDASDHMFCRFTGIVGACGASCYKVPMPICAEGYAYFNGYCYKA
ncbi:hypothetical protein niasHT_025946 [Heterodera trifolii]|uniref:Uncharacterized protein n=1 Tax=Heterodera trifolii TaxID=157864 RepID=A0ABD2KNJ1_9BILA